MEQLLFPIIHPEPIEDTSIEARFEAFHTANPHVYDAIVAIARDLKQRGLPQCSMHYIYNRLRWLHMIQTNTTDEYKLNDHFTALYSRLVMDQEPDLADFFEVRRRRSCE